MKEIDLQKQIAVAISKTGNRVWINDNGFAFHKVGDKYIGFMYGLGKGISDLIGFTKINITQEMVGKTLPIFTAIEVKYKNGYLSKGQEAFIKFIKDNGGISGVARSVEDALLIVEKEGEE